MAKNNKIIGYLILLFIAYKVFLKKESFILTTGQINYGTIDLYCINDSSQPVVKAIVSPNISSVGTKNLPSKSSSFSIENLPDSTFNPNTLNVVCHSKQDGDSWKVSNIFGDSIGLIYNKTSNKLELSGLTTVKTNINTQILRNATSSNPVLAARLLLTWIN